MTCGFCEILFVLKIKYIHPCSLTALSVYVLKDKAYRFSCSYVHGQPNDNTMCNNECEIEIYLVCWRISENKKVERNSIFVNGYKSIKYNLWLLEL